MFTLYSWYTNVQLAFAGVTQFIVSWGFFGSLAAGLVAAAYFSKLIVAVPVVGPLFERFIVPIRKDLYWAAFGCVLIMFGMYVGAKDATNRCVAKQVVIEKIVTKAVDKTSTPRAKKQADRWDKTEY